MAKSVSWISNVDSGATSTDFNSSRVTGGSLSSSDGTQIISHLGALDMLDVDALFFYISHESCTLKGCIDMCVELILWVDQEGTDCQIVSQERFRQGS